jgi:hypothetical protein
MTTIDIEQGIIRYDGKSTKKEKACDTPRNTSWSRSTAAARLSFGSHSL